MPIINLAEEVGRYLPGSGGEASSGGIGGGVASGVAAGVVGGILGGLFGGKGDES
jgi:hypothetical protein